MGKINKNRLLNLVGEGKTEEAIEETLKVTVRVDEDVHAQIIAQKGRYRDLKRGETSGMLSFDEVSRQKARINTALLDIINDLPDEYPAKPRKSSPGGTVSGGGTVSTPLANRPGGSTSNSSQPLDATNYVLLFLLLLFIAIGMYAFFSFTDGVDNTELFMLMVVLGLIVAIGTHGVMTSQSNIQSSSIRLGGPIVACLITVIGGYYFLKDPPISPDNKPEQTSVNPLPGKGQSQTNPPGEDPPEPTTTIVYGCMNEKATNYNPKATKDDGTCIIQGCTNKRATNYNPQATEDDGTCRFRGPTTVYGCTNQNATNYNPDATQDDGSCIKKRSTVISGCTDPNATNYNSSATQNDGSCTYAVRGCNDPNATNYNSRATINDGSCKYPVRGCTDPKATNYNSSATIDDNSCKYPPPKTASFSIKSDFTIGGIKIDGEKHDHNVQAHKKVSVVDVKQGPYEIEVLNNYGQVKAKCNVNITSSLREVYISSFGECNPTNN